MTAWPAPAGEARASTTVLPETSAPATSRPAPATVTVNAAEAGTADACSTLSNFSVSAAPSTTAGFVAASAGLPGSAPCVLMSAKPLNASSALPLRSRMPVGAVMPTLTLCAAVEAVAVVKVIRRPSTATPLTAPSAGLSANRSAAGTALSSSASLKTSSTAEPWILPCTRVGFSVSPGSPVALVTARSAKSGTGVPTELRSGFCAGPS